MNYEAIQVQKTGATAQITLNRPALRNAMSLQMVAELQAALVALEADKSVRVLVLRGAGGHFCAGADLQDMASARMRALQNPPASTQASVALDAVAQVNAQFGDLCVAYAQTPLALVAVLEGSVMGGGLGLACVADVALASESAVFRLPETALGVVPAQIAPFLVERLGYSQAKRLAVTGGRLNAANALAMGLVHAVHAPEQIDAVLAAVLAEIQACAPGAVAATKALMAKARLCEPASLVQEAARIFSRAAQGPEGLEGIAAFLQKRKPSWAQP
ncbi:enoyl-CoA hydratase-related protein [Rhodoferax sp.]|uniref:enoyl-CoA hydratase/isomerase family protein n=1 Tax=Rhodoferax sp. TaxID=50421 RepID=UPI0025F5F286|nr:enoyl-CoA hydratase-related protein [Rhodoferax sp.]